MWGCNAALTLIRNPFNRKTLYYRYSCESPCQRQLSCEVEDHLCPKTCHSGACPPCPLSPQVVKTCPCGQTSVTDRTSCRDPIPTCGRVCGKRHECGPVGNNHTCKEECHLGDCPPCPLTTEVRFEKARLVLKNTNKWIYRFLRYQWISNG